MKIYMSIDLQPPILKPFLALPVETADRNHKGSALHFQFIMLSSALDVTVLFLQRSAWSHADQSGTSPLTARKIVALLILGVLLLVCRGVYNRYFHPLSHIPGPFWASVTDFYKIYVVLTKHFGEDT